MTKPEMKEETKTLPKLTVSQILAARRRELDLTHAEIASYLGIKAPEFIGMVEKGTRHFDLNRIPLLADVLQFKRADLVKIALAEQTPLAYDALYSADPVGPKAKPYTRRTEAQEIIDLFYRLPESARKVMLSQLRG